MKFGSRLSVWALLAFLALFAPAFAQEPLTEEQLIARANAGDGNAAYVLGEVYNEGKLRPYDPAKALAFYQRALTLGVIRAAYKVALIEADTDPQAAYDLLKQSRPAFEVATQGDGVAMGNYLMLYARAARGVEKYREALALDQESLDHADQYFDPRSATVAFVKSNMAITLMRLDRADEAARQLLDALAIFKRVHGGNDPRVLNIYNNLGMAYEEMSRFGDAADAYRKALALARRSHRDSETEVALQKANLASVLDRAGHSDEAEKLYREAVAAIGASEGTGSELYAHNLGDMGTVLVSTGKYAEALAAERTALAILEKQKTPNGSYIAGAHYAIGNILNGLEKSAEAIPEYEQAIAGFSAIYGADSLTVATVRADMAGAKALVQGREREAIEDFNAALPVMEQGLGQNSDRVAILLNNLAFAYGILKDYDNALAAQQKSLKISAAVYGPASIQVASGYVNSASSMVKQGRTDAALVLLARALPVYATSGQGNDDTIRKLYFNMAELLNKTAKPHAAVLFAKLAINAHEDLRSRNAALSSDLGKSLAVSLAPAYDLLVDQQIADGAFSQSQYVGTLIKSSEIAAAAGGSGPAVPLTKIEQKLLSDINTSVQPVRKLAEALRQQFAAVKGEGQVLPADATAAYDGAAEKLAATLAQLFTEAEADHGKWQAELVTQNQQQAAQMQKQLAVLGPRVALYQAIATDDTLHLFISAAGRETVHREVKIARADLARKVFDATNAVEQRSPDADQKLTDLYATLITPVAADLKQATPGVVMLDLSGFLRYVPYAALRHDGRYLIEDYALALYTPAAKTRFVNPGSEPPTAAGFGVTEAHGDFPALPGVGHELSAIFASGGGTLEGTSETDQAFTEQSLRDALKAHPRYVHIASHFKFVPGRENNSFLLLGNGDGLSMTALRKDKGLQFRGVDLLTLSACETARGGGAEGEEVESFGALAQANGASAVMATLWQIADESTAKLMSDFYEGRVREGLDKATALQRAQIAMLRGVPAIQVATARGERGVTAIDEASTEPALPQVTARHPYYWAAFILMGNWM
ncbi:CHAT domain-containing protein [Aestuariivirga sp.]|uniref:CHAT domain-containing tetratricopeptide repeat protein n=1 Tax=Aestuariivirga sp. TaxID=2650926 RepID=UPI0039E4C801